MGVHKTNKTNQEQNLRIQTLLFPFAKKANENPNQATTTKPNNAHKQQPQQNKQTTKPPPVCDPLRNNMKPWGTREVDTLLLLEPLRVPRWPPQREQVRLQGCELCLDLPIAASVLRSLQVRSGSPFLCLSLEG